MFARAIFDAVSQPDPPASAPPPAPPNLVPVQTRYIENESPQYFVNVPNGYDYEGNMYYKQVPVPANQVQRNFQEDGEGGTYQTLVVPQYVYEQAVEAVTAPQIPKDYTRPQEVQQSGAFTTQPGAGENVNDFSFGQLGKIYDSINTGAYKVSPDKSTLITPYGDFSMRPIGNGLYDIPIGAKSGSYNVAIGVTDDNQAVFNKDFIDKGAIRYVGGSPGGFISNMLNDLGPVSNIALAALMGPGAGLLPNVAAQTALNAAKGQDFEDALKGGVISGGITSGIGALTGAGGTGYEGLGSGLGGGEYYDSLGAGADDIMTSIGGVGQMGGSLPTTDFPLGAGVSDLSGLATPETGIYPGEGVPSGIPAWDKAYTAAGGVFDPAYATGAGVADLAAAGAAGAGLSGSDILKYAGLAGLAGSVLQPKRVITPEGVDQTPVGAGLSPDYKPYRYMPYADGGIVALADGGYNLGGYSDGGRLLRGPGDGVSDSIPATIGEKRQPARLADGEFVVPARIVSELGNGSTEAGARKLYAMMDRIQAARQKTVGKKAVAKNTRSDKHLPA